MHVIEKDILVIVVSSNHVSLIDVLVIKDEVGKGDFLLRQRLDKMVLMRIPSDVVRPRGLLLHMLHTLLCFLDLLLGHALQSLLPVLMHVDVELVEEVLRLYVSSIII